MNPILIPLLLKHEGLSLKAYYCTAGVLTIGVGHNIKGNRSSITALRLNLHEGSYITEAEAMQILKEDVARCLFELRTFHWFYDLSVNRQVVIVDMLFNMGLGTFITFKKFIAAMEGADYDTASKEMLNSKWASQVGERAHTLSYMIETNQLVN